MRLPGLDNIQTPATLNCGQNSSKVGGHRGLMSLFNRQHILSSKMFMTAFIKPGSPGIPLTKFKRFVSEQGKDSEAMDL